MLKRAFLCLALLLAPAAALAQSSKLSNLTAGGAITGTDLFYDVQTVGVGGVKVTGTQLLGFVTGTPNTFSAIQTFSATNGIVYSGAAVGTQVACLGLDASNNVVKNAAACGSGGGGTPGGATTQLQYNNAGAFGGISGVTSNGTNLTITSTLIYSGAAVGTQVACLGLDGSNNTVKDAAACGTVVSVSAGCGTSSGGSPITGTGTIFAAEVPNLRAGTTYTIANADCGTLNNFSNAAAIAVTLPQAGSGGNFANGWYNDVCSIGAGTATITPTTSTIGGVATLVLTTNKCARIVSDGTNYQVVTYGGGGGGGTPGGANTNVQFNSSGSFGGDAGFTYTTLGQVTIAGGTITTNNKALTITQTWNNGAVKFDAPLLTNITMTAADSSSALMDIQAGGVSLFQIQNQYVGAFLNRSLLVMPISSVIVPSNNGVIYFGGPVAAGNGVNNFGSPRWFGFSGSAGPGVIQAGGGVRFDWYYGNNDIAAATGIAVSIFADGTNVVQTNAIAIGNGATATAFRVYNTTDGSGQVPPTNFERGVFDWTTTANTLTIGTQKSGTGSSRSLQVVLGGLDLFDYGVTAPGVWNFIANGGSGQAVVFWPDTNNRMFIGANAAGATGMYFGSGNGLIFANIATVFPGDPSTNNDVSIHRSAPAVIGLGNGPLNNNGWLNWTGEQRTTAPTTYTSNTTLSTILTANVLGARTYSFDIYIPVTASLSTGGIKVALSGTATVTNMIADSWVISNNAITNQVQVTSLTTLSNGLGGAATGAVRVQGTITVNAAGTFLVQTAQNTSSATATVVGQGARLVMQDMP